MSCAALVVVLTALALSGCSVTGFDTSREAAEAWTIGVVSDDLQMVSDALGRDVSAQEVASWREDLLGLSETYQDVVPGLGVSAENERAASYILESITVDGATIYSDGQRLDGAALVVRRDDGWHVLAVEPLTAPE